ncbi:hypothetical protein AP058_02856 [Flavobacterium sp. TAB 87]|nr:hypothetical protein AP058_02856 [Flavobacterium sp. TAB 87]
MLLFIFTFQQLLNIQLIELELSIKLTELLIKIVNKILITILLA